MNFASTMTLKMIPRNHLCGVLIYTMFVLIVTNLAVPVKFHSKSPGNGKSFEVRCTPISYNDDTHTVLQQMIYLD